MSTADTVLAPVGASGFLDRERTIATAGFIRKAELKRAAVNCATPIHPAHGNLQPVGG